MSNNIKRALNKYLPHLISGKEQNLNEADTVIRIIKIFEDVFEYDVMTEITKELQIRERYVDIAIKLNGVIRLLIEVKAAGIELNDKHIEQAKNYAANGNYRWVLLTNGTAWKLYHLTFEEGIEDEKVFSIDLTKDTIDDAIKCLSLLSRESVSKNGLDDYWTKYTALGPESIGNALFAEETLWEMRKVIKKKESFLVDIEDLAAALQNLLSTESRERIGPMKIHRKKKASKPQPAQDKKIDPEPAVHKEIIELQKNNIEPIISKDAPLPNLDKTRDDGL